MGEYHAKLALQRERQKERKAKAASSSSSSFSFSFSSSSGFSPSMPVPFQLSTSYDNVILTSVALLSSCAVTFTTFSPIVFLLKPLFPLMLV